MRFARLFVPLQKMMHYADLILPVPLPGLFTYAVPEGMSVRVGARVLVTFGRSKTYLGIVAKVHDVKPEGYQVKPITQVVDDEPIVTERQLQLLNCSELTIPGKTTSFLSLKTDA